MDFRFAEPSWSVLLWLVLGLTALLLWLDARGAGALTRFLSPVMQARLVRAPGAARRRTSIVLLGLSFLFMVLALMRPQWGVQFVATPRVGAEIMVALDVSNSMLAEDVAPNRLERAKAELRDLLTYLHGDSVGLIAFAGRATVLAPLTPDFSFLRLVLDSAGPRSVSRGGTRLEEPIRKAVAGFAGAGAVSRSIILITDGEDHDSFPVEAAKEAAERGVKILAIGFGDENGSEIRITDPQTGARKPLRDGNGKPVISRLDGDLLREIALATGGAYIPAGTGVLDLQSIYDRHIAGLTRGELDGQNRTIRNEAYQWAVLLAVMFLVASVAASGSGRARRMHAAATSAATAAGMILLASTLLAAPRQAAAQQHAPAPEPGLAVDDGTAHGEPGEESPPAGTGETDYAEPAKPPQDTRPPREIYNEGLAKLEAGDLAAAAEALESARSKARLDNELRVKATYNLGIVETRVADSKLESQPEEALASLERAAAWFRDAVSLDEKDQDARYNLELVLRRALVLADAIAKKKEKSLLDDLMALMEEQRTFLAGLRETMQQSDPADAHADEKLRRAYRTLASRQLELGSTAEDLSDRAGAERDTIAAKPADQQTPEDAMHAARLTGVLEYLHRARERIGQARGRLRRIEGEGAYRAGSSVLTELKRARDQLLDPVQVLDVLIQDTLEMARLSGAKAALDAGSTEIEPQKWLTNDFLADSAAGMRERVEQLHHQFVAGVAQADAQKNSGEQLPPEHEPFLQRVREAEPHLGKAVEGLANAKPPLESGRVQESLQHQYAALESLAAARERFLDFRRLVELLAQDEQRIEGVITPKEGATDEALAEYAPMALEVQQSNVERGRRAEQTLEEQLAAATTAMQAAEAAAQQQQQGADPNAPAAPPDQKAAMEKQRLELARPLLAAARTAMDEAAARLSEAAAAASSGIVDWTPPRAAVRNAVERIEDVRRLFFSVIEHLQELARRQVELGDSTEEVSALAASAPDKDYADRAGPLGARQQTLAQTAGPIAQALRTQSQQPLPPEAQGQVPEDFPQRLAQAADHVDAAATQMEGAMQGLSVNPPTFPQVREQQNAAVQSLAEALRLLQPPQEQEQQQEQQEQQEEQQQQEQQDPQQQQGGQQQQQAGQEAADPAQLLQGIRDRDAKRRAEKDKGGQKYDPVEKDW
ncbi:MAG TPA: VWA domain-containing protein [Candidatus Binatia bacterium]|nr:VWA domain-containing protein [Candidatus Binatia bacterium]